jgi:SH3-like domain-containing protein
LDLAPGGEVLTMRCIVAIASIVMASALGCGLAAAAEPAPAPVKVPVMDAYVDIRTGPDLDFPVIFVALKGDVLTVRAHIPGWYGVDYEKGRSGWIPEEDMNRVMARAGMKFGLLAEPLPRLADADGSVAPPARSTTSHEGLL